MSEIIPKWATEAAEEWIDPDPSKIFNVGDVKHLSAVIASHHRPTHQDVHIIFDGPPSHESGRFVEVQTPEGRGLSLNYGAWIELDDGLWALVIPVNAPKDEWIGLSVRPPEDEAEVLVKDSCNTKFVAQYENVDPEWPWWISNGSEGTKYRREEFTQWMPLPA